MNHIAIMPYMSWHLTKQQFIVYRGFLLFHSKYLTIEYLAKLLWRYSYHTAIRVRAHFHNVRIGHLNIIFRKRDRFIIFCH